MIAESDRRQPVTLTNQANIAETMGLDLGGTMALVEPGAEAQDIGLLGRIGPLETRLAATADEVRAAQRLRFDVFTNEFNAQISSNSTDLRDEDRYDAICDHLLVIDTSLPGEDANRLVGTYRLLRQAHVTADLPFYSSASFDLTSLMRHHPDRRFLELGRSCVLPAYRSKRTIELLWQGIWAYCRRHEIDVMTGCASFSGIDPEMHAEALSFLHHHARATGSWAVRAQPDMFVSMNRLPADQLNAKAALRSLPPLIKGYLRLGATFGEGAVIDHEFNSIDVLVVLPVEQINERYLSYYGEDASRFAA